MDGFSFPGFDARVFFGNFSEEFEKFDKANFSEKLGFRIIETIQIHEKYVYNATHFLNDIALVKVKGSFDPKRIVPLCSAGVGFGSKQACQFFLKKTLDFEKKEIYIALKKKNELRRNRLIIAEI